jgi:hypothetical protein
MRGVNLWYCILSRPVDHDITRTNCKPGVQKELRGIKNEI